jgi:hypothetical protein
MLQMYLDEKRQKKATSSARGPPATSRAKERRISIVFDIALI